MLDGKKSEPCGGDIFLAVLRVFIPGWLTLQEKAVAQVLSQRSAE